MESQQLLVVEALTAGYGSLQIVRNVSISVGPREIVALVGPNGAGKSTVLRAIVGVAHVFSGEVRFVDRVVTSSPLEELVRLGVGYVPQGDDTFSNLTVRENLEMGGYLLRPVERRERVAMVLERWPQLVSMLKRRTSALSGGQQKMVAVGRAMMLEPRLLILDEPTAGLSEQLTRVVIEDISVGLARSGTSVLLVEQKARIVLETADRAYVLVQGEVAMAAPAKEVLAAEGMAEIFLGGGTTRPT